jgi:hypothetical protein
MDCKQAGSSDHPAGFDPSPTARRTVKVHAAGGAMQRIQGQLLRISERREVALYLRDGALWIADFVDDVGALCEVRTWLRFHCSTTASWEPRRRMALESAVPLSEHLVERIEALHAALPPSSLFAWDNRTTGGDA